MPVRMTFYPQTTTSKQFKDYLRMAENEYIEDGRERNQDKNFVNLNLSEVVNE